MSVENLIKILLADDDDDEDSVVDEFCTDLYRPGEDPKSTHSTDENNRDSATLTEHVVDEDRANLDGPTEDIETEYSIRDEVEADFDEYDETVAEDMGEILFLNVFGSMFHIYHFMQESIEASLRSEGKYV